MSDPKHPMQSIVLVDGVARFKANQIVCRLLELCPLDINQIARMPFSADDREQFAQLIGYSVSGFGDISYASAEVVRAADEAAEELARGES